MAGRLEWIGIRPLPRESVRSVPSAEIVEGYGLKGDHRALKKSSRRQVTLIQFEHLALIAAELNRPEIRPDILRRNLLVSGIDLLECRDQIIQIGSVVLQGTGTCPPCNRMDEALGPGGRRIMKGRGGITARILVPGVLTVGDAVRCASLFPEE